MTMNESNRDTAETESTEDDERETPGGDADRKSRPRRPGRPSPEVQVPRLAVADADERSRDALAFTIDLIVKMGMTCDVSLQPPGEEGTDIQIHVTGPDAGRIIGKKGQVLAAVQFIVNRAMNRPGIERRYVSVDADGYRSRREDSLASMARRLGKQAISDGQIITFEPMSPRDRRVVHLALAKFDGVVTKSEGEGDDRRVQIIPVRRG